ncbi:cell division inhibitor [Cutibacterium avidum ATCC 25577]|uniref:Cell division inhibitor n=1 Tax=Cutibacterium avidum ATCC 25577 TaxID=997355 RepID=G4CXJ4_9ACTN|nr:cell division inhibitor [Cutibacterium avidum ATCC 25577]
MNIVITGEAGFIGQYVTRRLHGHDLIVRLVSETSTAQEVR